MKKEQNELVCMRCGNVMSICQSKCKDKITPEQV